MITAGPGLEIDEAGWTLAKRYSPENPALLFEAMLPRVELAEPLHPVVLDLAWGDHGNLCFEILRLPAGADNGRSFLIRDGLQQREEFDRMARAQALIELSYEGFTIFDASATILFESASNHRITGYRQDECVGRSLFEFIHPDDAERLIPRFARLAERPGDLDADIVRWRHRQGHWIYLQGTVVNQLEDPHIRGMINTFHDVTSRVEMEHQLKAAKETAERIQEQQQRFLAMLSHELRTPLTLLKQPLEELLPATSKEPRWGIVTRSLNRLESLVGELVDFTVADSGQARLRVREVAVATFLQDLLREIEPLATARKMKLTLQGDALETPAYLDRSKFAMVLHNLVGNAIKFGPTGSEILVRYREVPAAPAEPGFLEIEVEDAGTPIPEDERERIFERFYQIGEGDRRGWEGMGLGLTLAHQMTTLHGGELGVRPGSSAGNCFWVRIPLGAGHIAIEELEIASEENMLPPLPLGVFPSPEADESATAPSIRVLIVEDHPDLRRYLALHLETIYDLRFAENGKEALPMVLSSPPDLVLSDVMMPGLDGIGLCQKVREHFSAEALPFLLLSAKNQPEDRLRGLQAGANDYLSKPFSMDELRLRIHNQLATRRKAQNTPTAWPERVRELMRDLLADGPFGAAELANALNLSQRQLQRRCIEAFGQTPGQLIQEVRLQQARRLLEAGEVTSVSAAARAIGLSPSYLSRRFRAMFDEAPKAFLTSR